MHTFSWGGTPDGIREALLQGGVGRVHLHETAHRIFQTIGQGGEPAQLAALFALGSDMLLAAWESAPYDPALAATLLNLHGQKAFLPTPVAGVLKFVSRLPAPDPELDERLEPGKHRDLAAWYSQLLKEQRNGSGPLLVLDRAVDMCLREHQPGWLGRVVETEAALPRPVKQALLADVAFAQGLWDEAATGYAAAHAALPLLTWQVRRAESLYRIGRRDEAVALWREALARRPWNVNMLLRLTDVLAGRDTAPAGLPPGRGAVLLYTWNKGPDMDATLASVAASDLGENRGADSAVRICVLDNGSTDSSPEVFRKWEAHFGGRLSITTLPVNVGAPAARNWLLSLPYVREADWAAFLDDDVNVPADWLAHLWTAVTAYPESGVASGHAVDFHAPMSQQWTDMHIVPLPVPEGEDSRVFRDRFKFTAPHEQAFDFGDFNFMRPCVTAIGCCHLFTRKAMDEGGTFDVRFSPSQSDDVDHDMRRGLAGCLPVYNGHLRVLHKRSTGYHKTPNRRGWASAVGNWYKLQASYTPEEVAELYATDQRLMLDDVQTRLAGLKGGQNG